MATTSGTATENLDVLSLSEEAWERVGAELRTGYDLRTTRRSMNLMLMDWANRGVNLWLLDQGEIELTQGDATYNLPVDTIDLLEHVVRTGTGLNQQDISISRISNSTYASIPNKLAQGRPVQVWINRLSGVQIPVDGIQYPTVTVWPTPDQDDYYTLVYWRLRRIQDAGNGTNVEDMPFRFVPAFVAGLAYYLSLKIPGGVERTPMLKQMYEEEFQRAADEDREKASLSIVPRLSPSSWR